MRIFVQRYLKKGPSVPERLPAIVLVRDSWNDFGHRTLFNAFFVSRSRTKQSRTKIVELGYVKILQLGRTVTSIKSGISELSSNYCSIGQAGDYYNAIRGLSAKHRSQVLSILRDIRHSPDVAVPFLSDPGFYQSLLRESEAERMFKEAQDGAERQEETILAFTFVASLAGARHPHEVTFDYRGSAILPQRVYALIGKNGTGKTQFLRRLADVASGTEVDKKHGYFRGSRPGFRSVIAVGYSAFDDFSKESTRTVKGYRYCGLYDKEGSIKTRTRLWNEAMAARANLVKKGRQAVWKTALESLFQADRLERILGARTEEDTIDLVPTHKASFSSGELFLLTMMSRVVSFLRQQSLIIMDEPEMHLHPNAIGNLVRTLHLITKEFDSYAIVATHSPLVLQQIPSRFVRILRRVGNTPMVERLGVESFGENLTTLTESVFHAADEPQVFADWFSELATKYSHAEIEDAFDGYLSYNARTYLHSIIRGRQELDDNAELQ